MSDEFKNRHTESRAPYPDAPDVVLNDLPRWLWMFMRDPIGSMKKPARMSWPAAFFAQTAGAAISGSIVALISENLLDFLVSIVIFPVIAVMVSSILTLFLYYLFAGIASTYLEIRRLNSLVVLASMPFFILHAFSGFLPPLDLIGFATTTVLMTVGLVEQFGLEKRLVFKTLGGVFAAFFVIWSLVQLSLSLMRGSP